MMYDQYVSIHGYGIGPLHLLDRCCRHHHPILANLLEGGVLGLVQPSDGAAAHHLIALYVLAFSDWPSSYVSSSTMSASNSLCQHFR